MTKKDLLSILKIILIPELKKAIKTNEKSEEKHAKEDSPIAWYYCGLAAAQKYHLEQLEKIADALEGKQKKKENEEE